MHVVDNVASLQPEKVSYGGAGMSVRNQTTEKCENRLPCRGGPTVDMPPLISATQRYPSASPLRRFTASPRHETNQVLCNTCNLLVKGAWIVEAGALGKNLPVKVDQGVVAVAVLPYRRP